MGSPNVIPSFYGIFLSNFANCPHGLILPETFCGIDDRTYPSVEHAFQAAKTFDLRKRDAMIHGTAAQAKRLGRSLRLRPDWEKIKEDVMLDLLRQKYRVEPFRSLLLRTGSAELIEGNRHGNTYWGVCEGVGKNRLGYLTMQVRSELEREGLV